MRLPRSWQRATLLASGVEGVAATVRSRGLIVSCLLFGLRWLADRLQTGPTHSEQGNTGIDRFGRFAGLTHRLIGIPSDAKGGALVQPASDSA